MQATGITFRAQSSVATGTTSLTITKPSGTVDNDIMLMWLTHKGAGYATMPAGWTLVAQNLSGSTRGELYWKRASGEGASYSITGLADTALGMIASYIGGLLVGNVVDVSHSVSNATGVRTSPSVTTTQLETLLVSSIHIGENSAPGTQGTSGTVANGQTNFYSNFGDWDEQLLVLRTLTGTGTTTGSDCYLAVSGGCKVIPGMPGSICSSNSYTGENVRIIAAIIPELSQVSAGTRFYFSDDPPPVRINDLVAGEWDSNAYTANISGPLVLTFRLAPRKTQTFHLDDGNFVTNRQGNYDELLARWVTPPVEAQTVAGTLDVSLQMLAMWLATAGLTGNTHACYKVHAYIAVGETGVPRHTLIDNYVDSSNEFPRWPSTQTWMGFAAPQSLTSGAALDGDTIIIELGVRIISSPTPTPTEPPTEYTQIRIEGYNATIAGNNTSTGIGAIDSTHGTTTLSRAGWLDFSQTIVLKADPPAAVNSTYAGAIVLSPTLPLQTTPLDVRSASSSARTLWYSFTPAESGNVGVFVNGSTYGPQFVILTGTPGAFSAEDDYQDRLSSPQRGQSSCSFDATSGVTYYICLYLSSFTSAYNAGELWLTLTYRDIVPAEGDLYIPDRNIYAYRDGVPINWAALPFTPTGCAIDYSRIPMYDIEPDDGTLNTDERIYIQSFGGSALVEILELPTLCRGRAEVDFIFDAIGLGSNDAQNGAGLAISPATNQIIIGCWGHGFLDVNAGGTSGSIAAFFDSPSPTHPEETAMYRCSVIDGDSQGLEYPGLPTDAERFEGLTVDSTTAWIMAMSADGSTAYYSSNGFYIPPRATPAAFTLRAYNLDTTTQLPDVGTIPPSSSPAAAAGPHGLAVHSDGTIFITNQGEVVRMRLSDGAIVQTYLPIGDYPGDNEQLWDVHIMPDGASIVAIDGDSMAVFQWDIGTGVQIDHFQTWMGQGNYTQFAIYQPTTLPEPPDECVGERGDPITDGLPYSPLSPAPCEGDGERGDPPTGA